MSSTEAARRHATVIQPSEGDSFWQPVPANGHADPKLTPANTRYGDLSMGYQTIAPRSRVREHAHGDQIELQICFRGRGRVVVDGVSHPLVPGTACFLGYDVKHEIINETDEELVMLWMVSPAGLENFFKAIGRPRTPGDPAPAPFARPENGVEIERASGMTYKHPGPASPDR
jgi:quercetin dioxygenase-like cupin family protein